MRQLRTYVCLAMKLFLENMGLCGRTAGLAGMLGLTSGVAQAVGFGAASPFNVFVFEGMTESNVDSEGRVAVGGNAFLTNFGVGSAFSSNPSSAGNSLVVGGNLSYSGGEVHFGNVVYGGLLSGTPAVPNGTLTQSGGAVDFTATRNSLVAYSTYWAGLASTGATSYPYGAVNLVGTDANLNIFDLSGADLASAWGVTIDAPAGSTVLVNIDGTADSFDNLGINFDDLNNDGTGRTDKQRVLFNFYTATSLAISGISVKGSILAPNAAVTFGNGNVEGNLIARELTGSGEAHNFLFNGSLPEMSVP